MDGLEHRRSGSVSRSRDSIGVQRSADSAREARVSPAVRPPPGNPRFPMLDGMRTVAIVIVVFAHVTVMTGAVYSAWGFLPMNAPVADVIFFALSGFLLYRPFASGHAGLRAAPAIVAFARRRVLRLVPAYWPALTA